ncbi:MAG: hypothetical protein JWP56_1423 [Aeromicrobium sp.]|nr:hypothetical protein [Aeromicrobium sp.]
MSARGRRLAVFLPVVVTVLLAGVIGALVIVQDQRQTDQVARAERIGNDYLIEVEAFRSEIAREVNGVREADPGRLRRVVIKAIEDPPELPPGAPAYGRERSKAYAQALAAQRTVLRPYQRLSRELRRADIALDFIAAARGVLRMRVTELIGTATVTSSAPIRSRVIPAFVKARDTFARVRVPAGQDALAAQVRDAAQYVIDQATTLADRIDGSQGYSFSYATPFQSAADAVDDYATVVKGDVAEAINAVTEDR